MALSNIERRLSRLEEEAGPTEDQRPLVLWGDAPVPANAGNRSIIRYRWRREGEVTPQG